MRLLAPAFVTILVAGCLNHRHYNSPERLAKGKVYILPGIEGVSAANLDIRRGLDRAGVPYALEIHPWGFPVPGIGLIVNQTNVAGNRRAARRLAADIVDYQRQYAGRPVFLVGHSGGGGIAVFTLEAMAEMPKAKPATGAFLLAASISRDYDLHTALRMVERGIVNVYNPNDVALLGVGTTLIGNVDGKRGPSAGLRGFTHDYPNLFQARLPPDAAGPDPHTAATSADLIARRAPNWLMSESWPPERVATVRNRGSLRADGQD